MRKLLGTCLLVVSISCAAIWGTQQIRFFQRLPMAVASQAFAANTVSNQGRPPQPDPQEFHAPTRPNDEMAERPQKRERGASSAGWMNILAYCSIFVFVVMQTYYIEQRIQRSIGRHA